MNANVTKVGYDTFGHQWTLPREAVESYTGETSSFQKPNIRNSSNPQNSYYSNMYNIERYPVPPDARSVYFSFFSIDNVNYISEMITQKLKGVHPEGKNIIVDKKQILSVMDSIYKNTFRDIDKMTVMTVGYIVDYVSGDLQMEFQNKKLNIWVTNFTPESGIRQYSKIKVRDRRGTPMIFNMNY